MRAAAEARSEIPELEADESSARAALQRAQNATQIGRLFADAIVAPTFAGLTGKRAHRRSSAVCGR